MKKILIVLAMLAVLAIPVAAWSENIALVPDHGSLWKLAEECGQSGSTWEKIIAKNPWIKVKVVQGKRIPIVQPGQPIILPDDWIAAMQEDEEPNILASLWEDYLDIAKTHPVPSIIVFLLFGAVVTAKSYIPKPKKNAVQHTPQKNNRQYESIVLPG